MEEHLYSDSDEDIKEKNSYSDLYKYSNRTIDFTLEKKRQLFLQKQKEKRSNAFDEKRDLSELFSHDESSLTPTQNEESANIKRPSKNFLFKYKLIDAEWLTEIPDDLAENWLIKLCPGGIRQLVVANKAKTLCYYKNGKLASRMTTRLPGGTPESATKFTILDCVYNKSVNTLFVYDVLAWNSLSLLNAEAHMRFYWLKSKVAENPEMFSSCFKKVNFILMDFFPAEQSLLQEQLFISFVINECEVSFDGVLFYHREGHYTFNCSPLVGWLKTFMIPELLNIDVHPRHLSNKPEDYTSIQQYLSSKKKKRHKNKVDMEVQNLEREDMDYDNL